MADVEKNIEISVTVLLFIFTKRIFQGELFSEGRIPGTPASVLEAEHTQNGDASTQ